MKPLVSAEPYDETDEHGHDKWASEPERVASVVPLREPEADAEFRARFPLLSPDLMDPNRPARRWFLAGLVPEGDHVSIVAPGGTGKSLLVLALAVAAVRGDEEFLGRTIDLHDDGKVLYVDKENSEDDWAERLGSLGVTDEEWRAMVGSRFLPLSFPQFGGLDTVRGADDFLRLLDVLGVGKGDVLILDSTQRVTDGPENDNDTMRDFYTECGEELKRRGITVIRTDNTGKDADRGARGASAKRDDVGYSYLLTRLDNSTGPNGAFALRNTKFRGLGNESGLRFDRLHEDGITSFNVVDETLVTPDDERARALTAEGEMRTNILKVIRKRLDAGKPITSKNGVVAALKEDGLGARKGAVNEMVDRLIDAGQLSPDYTLGEDADGEAY